MYDVVIKIHWLKIGKRRGGLLKKVLVATRIWTKLAQNVPSFILMEATFTLSKDTNINHHLPHGFYFESSGLESR